jgi:hypothetical protein
MRRWFTPTAMARSSRLGLGCKAGIAVDVAAITAGREHYVQMDTEHGRSHRRRGADGGQQVLCDRAPDAWPCRRSAAKAAVRNRRSGLVQPSTAVLALVSARVVTCDEGGGRRGFQGPTFQPVAAARTLSPKWLSFAINSLKVASRVSDVACRLNKPAFSSMGGFLNAPQIPMAVANPLN